MVSEDPSARIKDPWSWVRWLPAPDTRMGSGGLEVAMDQELGPVAQRGVHLQARSAESDGYVEAGVEVLEDATLGRAGEDESGLPADRDARVALRDRSGVGALAQVEGHGVAAVDHQPVGVG